MLALWRGSLRGMSEPFRRLGVNGQRGRGVGGSKRPKRWTKLRRAKTSRQWGCDAGSASLILREPWQMRLWFPPAMKPRRSGTSSIGLSTLPIRLPMEQVRTAFAVISRQLPKLRGSLLTGSLTTRMPYFTMPAWPWRPHSQSSERSPRYCCGMRRRLQNAARGAPLIALWPTSDRRQEQRVDSSPFVLPAVGAIASPGHQDSIPKATEWSAASGPGAPKQKQQWDLTSVRGCCILPCS